VSSIIEVVETTRLDMAQQWAQAIAKERDWRYIQTSVVTEDWLTTIRKQSIAKDRRVIRICLALDEHPWLQSEG
jgi:hypothetical protein